MNAEYETLLKQLFVTWDIEKGELVKDFGFVKCEFLSRPTLRYSNVTFLEGGSTLGGIYTLTLTDKIEDKFPEFMENLVDSVSQGTCTHPEKVPFKVGDATLFCPGPIGIRFVGWGYTALIAFGGRFTVKR